MIPFAPDHRPKLMASPRAGTNGCDLIGDFTLKIVLLVLVLACSGHFAYRLATGVLDAWKARRLGRYEKNKPAARMVRSSARPVEFWLTMTLWHVMLVFFVAVFALGIYGILRVSGTGF